MLRLLDLFREDADAVGEPLPFVIWESHRPDPSAPPGEWEMWRARLRLFERVGGRWIEGVNFLAPDFARRGGPPVVLQLFLIPVDEREASFDVEALRDVVAGLHQNVYGRGKGDPLFDRTLPPGCRPRLRPAAEADSGPVPSSEAPVS
jgi:hypothetical protein